MRSRNAVRTAGAVLMGLSLAGCPADDDSDDTGASSATMTAGSSSTDPTTMGNTSDPSGTTMDIDPTTGPGPEPAYGVGATTGFTGTSTGGSSSGGGTESGGSSSTGDIGSTSIGGPEYGVPETSGE